MGFGSCSRNRPPVQLTIDSTPTTTTTTATSSKTLGTITTTTKAQPLLNRISRRSVRHDCKSFYWDISSVVLKTACLASFFVVEAPRRIVSYTLQKPEPTPFFTCASWGYRMCACGHHYYDHKDAHSSTVMFSKGKDVNTNVLALPSSTRVDSETASLEIKPSPPNESSSSSGSSLYNSNSKPKRRPFFLWPFRRL